MRDWVQDYSKLQLNALPRIAIQASMLSIEKWTHSACDLLQASMQSVIYIQAALLSMYRHHWSSKYQHNLLVQTSLVANPVSQCVACQFQKNTALYITAMAVSSHS